MSAQCPQTVVVIAGVLQAPRWALDGYIGAAAPALQLRLAPQADVAAAADAESPITQPPPAGPRPEAGVLACRTW
ncbi:hypothetical protein GCM10010109_63940 [Actinoplanes campanulatus]|nr:hypothetical protein GCM10010109_63940 [Actinoplanes campanulatus]GID39760.1 hypothetical protein Aca09nite_62660 [Actinoplanes campanulatus]